MSYEQAAFCGAIGRGEEIFWVNPEKKPYREVEASLPFSAAQIEDAEANMSVSEMIGLFALTCENLLSRSFAALPICSADLAVTAGITAM